MSWEERERERMLEAGVRAKGADYEQYLLAEAYDHAAMRRRTRAEAVVLGVKLAAKAPNGGLPVSTTRKVNGRSQGLGKALSGPMQRNGQRT